jgi:hypothetical protein
MSPKRLFSHRREKVHRLTTADLKGPTVDMHPEQEVNLPVGAAGVGLLFRQS